MTSPAIKLARECEATVVDLGALFTNAQLERFYALAQAQALRDAAYGYHKECDCTDYLLRMAEELERGA